MTDDNKLNRLRNPDEDWLSATMVPVRFSAKDKQMGQFIVPELFRSIHEFRW